MNNDYEAQLDTELVEIFRQLPEMDAPGLDALGVQQRVNRILAAGRDSYTQAEPDPAVTSEDLIIDGPDTQVAVRVYRPAESRRSGPLPAILWIHGGGFIIGNIEGDDAYCRELCRQVDCVIVSVEYRLAPQHPYPAAVDDCYTALSWLEASCQQLGADVDRIAVAGCSAGGCLAAAVALRARDEQGPKLVMQALLIPCLDDRCQTPSSHAVTEPQVWNRSLSLKTWAAYLANVTDEVPIYAAPGRAEDLACLPPSYISIAALDLLRDEAMDYAQHLMRSGVDTELHVYPGTFHGWFSFAPQARASIKHQADLVSALVKRFAV